MWQTSSFPLQKGLKQSRVILPVLLWSSKYLDVIYAKNTIQTENKQVSVKNILPFLGLVSEPENLDFLSVLFITGKSFKRIYF